MRHYCLLLLLVLTGTIGATAQTREAPGKNYTGVGPGHFIVSVSEDGALITLEDKSRWETDPAWRFRTMHWEPDANIAVVRGDTEGKFAYTLHNLDLDEGAGANYLPQ